MKKLFKILILFFALVLVFKPVSIYAWDDCVFEKVNDEFPGDCARYVDTDNDGICDHSQPAPEDRAGKKIKNDYHLESISIVLLLSYIFSFLLVKFKKINLVLHRKIWNIGLTLSFVVTGVLGILLVLKISYGININLPFKMIFWHVEAGIVFALISIFHILWHLRYYKNLLKLLTKFS